MIKFAFIALALLVVPVDALASSVKESSNDYCRAELPALDDGSIDADLKYSKVEYYRDHEWKALLKVVNNIKEIDTLTQ